MKELLYAVVPVTLAALTIFLIERLYRKIDFRRTSKIRGMAEKNGFRFIESKENLPLSYRPPSLGGILALTGRNPVPNGAGMNAAPWRTSNTRASHTASRSAR